MATELPEKPESRKESYLAKIAGKDVTIPEEPLSRIEQYLAYIAENGGGGGGGGIPTDVVDEFWFGTQDEYDAISPKAAKTLYLIKENDSSTQLNANSTRQISQPLDLKGGVNLEKTLMTDDILEGEEIETEAKTDQEESDLTESER